MSLLGLIKEEAARKARGEPPLPPPPAMRPGFARRTGQARKLMISTALSTLGGLAVILGWTWREGSWWTGAIGALVGLAGFLGQCLSVRCPRCRVAVVWYTFKTRNHAEAQAAAFYQPVCPKCGYDPP